MEVEAKEKTATGDSGSEKFQLLVKRDRCYRRLEALIKGKEDLAEIIARNSPWVSMPEYDMLGEAFDAAIEAEAKFLLNQLQHD